MSKLIQFIAILLTAIGIAIAAYFFYSLKLTYTPYGKTAVLMAESGQVGDFIGGVVGTILSLSGFILLLVTLWNQNKQNYLQQFESKFFDLLKIHRENVNEMTLERRVWNPKTKEIEYYKFEKRRGYKVILSEFINCRNELKRFFEKSDLKEIYNQNYLNEVATMLEADIENDKVKLKSIAKTNIAYCIVYFGVGKEGNLVLKSIFQEKYNKDFIDPLISYISMKPIESNAYWKKWLLIKRISPFKKRLEIVDKINKYRQLKKRPELFENFGDYFYDTEYIKFYGGHQHRLSHYFRHLFQLVNFVDNQTKLSFKERYFYVKTLRAQISTYEQALLFINSVSVLGYRWELDPKIEKSKISFINANRRKKKRLITKYNLIKNLPEEVLLGITYNFYYPAIKYEFMNRHQ